MSTTPTPTPTPTPIPKPSHTSDSQPKRKKETSSAKITLTIPKQLLERVDVTARHDYATRSDVIRQALVDYIRQYERAIGDMDPDKAIMILRRRIGISGFNKLLKTTKLDEE